MILVGKAKWRRAESFKHMITEFIEEDSEWKGADSSKDRYLRAAQ